MAKQIATWNPFRDITSLRDEMDRLFDSMLGRYPVERPEPFWSPAIDVEENKDNIIVRAELPGMKKDDIKVGITGDQLTISGERRHEAEEKGKTFHRIERCYGRFQRSLILPADIQADKAKASYKDGILELTLPKSEKAKVREITIQTE
ncbi:MAG: Hsp20/alpha crystallin family protein [candidate division WOR-3 bacterium]